MAKKWVTLMALLLLSALLLSACKQEQGSTLPDPDKLTYQEYIALDGKVQQAFMESFDSVEAFVEWYNAAQKAYLDSLQEITAGTDGAE